MKGRPKPGDLSPLFGFQQGGTADRLVIRDWRWLEQNRLQNMNEITTAADLIDLQPVEMGTSSEHDAWLRKFKGKIYFVPHHERERTVGLRTLVKEAEIAASSPGSGVQAVMGLLEAVDKIISEATDSTSALTTKTVLISPTDTEPLPERLRNNYRALRAIAEYLLAFSWFELSDWFPRKRAPETGNANYEKLVSKTIEELGNREIVENDKLVIGWKRARQSESRRKRYWLGQVDELNRHKYEDSEIEGTIRTAIKKYQEQRQAKADRLARITAELKGQTAQHNQIMGTKEAPGQASFEIPQDDGSSEPPLPTPARSGESDRQASQRNARAFREWDPGAPTGVDPELNTMMLRRMSSGNFTMPHQDK